MRGAHVLQLSGARFRSAVGIVGQALLVDADPSAADQAVAALELSTADHIGRRGRRREIDAATRLRAESTLMNAKA